MRGRSLALLRQWSSKLSPLCPSTYKKARDCTVQVYWKISEVAVKRENGMLSIMHTSDRQIKIRLRSVDHQDTNQPIWYAVQDLYMVQMQPRRQALGQAAYMAYLPAKWAKRSHRSGMHLAWKIYSMQVQECHLSWKFCSMQVGIDVHLAHMCKHEKHDPIP